MEIIRRLALRLSGHRVCWWWSCKLLVQEGQSHAVSCFTSQPEQGAKVEALIQGILEFPSSTCVTEDLNIILGLSLAGTKTFLID